jgi:hypothetical protein
MPLVLATGLAPSVLKEFSTYELETLTELLEQKG